jgi:hypothetical protein
MLHKRLRFFLATWLLASNVLLSRCSNRLVFNAKVLHCKFMKMLIYYSFKLMLYANGAKFKKKSKNVGEVDYHCEGQQQFSFAELQSSGP